LPCGEETSHAFCAVTIETTPSRIPIPIHIFDMIIVSSKD
jgi:hypothetical protein